MVTFTDQLDDLAGQLELNGFSLEEKTGVNPMVFYVGAAVIVAAIVWRIAK